MRFWVEAQGMVGGHVDFILSAGICPTLQGKENILELQPGGDRVLRPSEELWPKGDSQDPGLSG